MPLQLAQALVGAGLTETGVISRIQTRRDESIANRDRWRYIGMEVSEARTRSREMVDASLTQKVIITNLAAKIMGPVRNGAMSVPRAIEEVQAQRSNGSLSHDWECALTALWSNLISLKFEVAVSDSPEEVLEEWKFPYFPKVFQGRF